MLEMLWFPMMTDTRAETIRCARGRGMALLTVLLIIMAITVISLGFLSRSDVELACGQNMLLRFQMDQLANSALEHARGLLLNPQEVPSEYWAGAANLQLLAGSADYYDVSVARDASDANDRCTYSITCDAYRLRGTEKVGRSSLSADLRLDPCIALWTGADLTLPAHFALSGDLYCAGNVTNLGAVDGDAFCNGLSGNSIAGSSNPRSDLSLVWPAVTTDFTSRYATFVLPGSTLSNGTTLGPYDPVRVVHRPGNLTVEGNVNINGMLLVEGDLTISGNGSTITAAKNLPALYVTGNLFIGDIDGLTVEGLVVVDGNVMVSAGATNVRIVGGLFAKGTLRETADDSSAGGSDGLVYGSPAWRPAGGAVGGALEFDGSTDHVQTADSATALQLSGDYTLSVWVRPAAAQKAWAGVLCKTDSGGTANHWALQFDDGSPARLVVQHPTNDWDTGITLDDLAADGQWHHVAVVCQDANMTSYLDEVVKITPDPNTPAFEVPGSGKGHLNIGANRLGGSGSRFAGALDDVRVYDSALSQTNIQQLYRKQPVASASAPIGHWEFDAGGSAVTIIAAPVRSAVVVWSSDGREHWMPAADAFFRRIARQ